MKMYILLRKSMTPGFATVAAAHAAVKCFVEFSNHPDLCWWFTNSFKKVTVQVDDKQFERAKRVARHVLISESALEHEEQALAFCPRWDYPAWFRKLPLHR